MTNSISIQTIFDFFNNNPVLNIVSLLLAIFGIVFTTYFYYKSKKSRIPIYIIRTINLVRENIKKIDTVEILYSGEKINNLSISKIAFWNAGKETISSDNISLSNPIKVVISDGFEILDTEILFQKNTANDFKVKISEDNKSILVSFDYFDFEEGIVLQIFHTGNSSRDLLLDGKVKSVDKIIRKEYANSILPSILIRWLTIDRKISRRNLYRPIMGWTFLVLGIIFCVSVLGLTSFKNNIEISSKPKELSLYLKAFMTFPGLLYVWMGYRYIKKGIPKGFNIFNEEF